MNSVMEQILVPEVDLENLPPLEDLPRSLLYAIPEPIGGPGLGTTALETMQAAEKLQIPNRIICYGSRQNKIPTSRLHSLNGHPVRLLGNLVESKAYYGAKRQYADWIAGRMLRTGQYDCYHGWSSSSFHALRACDAKGIPSLIEIPTWHRNKGKVKPRYTKSEREALALTGYKRWKHDLEVNRQKVLDEYALADLVLVQSEKAAETFIEVGYDPQKIFYVARGVDPNRFRVTTQPDKFRLIFVGALIKRKGVHLLLEAWHKLNLQNAELVLVGHSHKEMTPYLEKYHRDSVTLLGRINNVEEELARSSAFVFPSECEGSAKATWEGASAGLPMISTREAGDATVDGVNGLIVPPNDADALACAIRHLYDHPELLEPMGQASRKRIEEGYTWEHFRARILKAWQYVMSKR